MRRAFSRRFLAVPSSLALALVTLPASRASAQDIAPPPPISPGAPGSPTAPGTPGTPGAPGTGTPDETTYKLDESEKKDSGRNFELFWLNGGVGGSYINMSQFSQESLQIKKTSSAGPAFDVGAGVRFVILVLGARLRYNALSSFNMWQINGEAGLKIPVSSFDIHFGLHGGYSFVGRLGDAGLATNTSTPASTDKVNIRGFNGGIDVGFDYYVSSLFSVGVGAIGDFLLLNRPPVDKPAGFNNLTPEQKAAIENDPVYQKSGTSAGLEIAGGLRLGLHLGL